MPRERDAAAGPQLPAVAARPGARARSARSRSDERRRRRRPGARASATGRCSRASASSSSAGELLAVLGPNGTGKTSLVRILLGLLEPSAGTVAIDGCPPRERCHRIGYVPQQRVFDRELTLRGRDLVRLGLDGHRWGFGRLAPADARRIDARARRGRRDRVRRRPGRPALRRRAAAAPRRAGARRRSGAAPRRRAASLPRPRRTSAASSSCSTRARARRHARRLRHPRHQPGAATPSTACSTWRRAAGRSGRRTRC